MEATPLSAKVLADALQSHGWQQADLADKAKIARPTVSHHVTGARVIRDDHLAAYSAVLTRDEQAALVAAWLQDTLPADVLPNVLDAQAPRLSQATRTWNATLTAEQQDRLDWWATKLAADAELESIFRAISRKAGWEPRPEYQQQPDPLPPRRPNVQYQRGTEGLVVHPHGLNEELDAETIKANLNAAINRNTPGG